MRDELGTQTIQAFLRISLSKTKKATGPYKRNMCTWNTYIRTFPCGGLYEEIALFKFIHNSIDVSRKFYLS